MTEVARGWISREELAAVYATAQQQQMAQTPGVDHPARRLAVHAIAGFFAAPITDDRPALRLVRPAEHLGLCGFSFPRQLAYLLDDLEQVVN